MRDITTSQFAAYPLRARSWKKPLAEYQIAGGSRLSPHQNPNKKACENLFLARLFRRADTQLRHLLSVVTRLWTIICTVIVQSFHQSCRPHRYSRRKVLSRMFEVMAQTKVRSTFTAKANSSSRPCRAHRAAKSLERPQKISAYLAFPNSAVGK
jgi:hypothetical protein